MHLDHHKHLFIILNCCNSLWITFIELFHLLFLNHNLIIIITHLS